VLLHDIVDTFFTPSKRVFIGYLALSAVIACGYWVYKHYSVRKMLSMVFSRRIGWSVSAVADYQVLLLNKVIMLLVSPLLLAKLSLATAIFFTLYEWFPTRPVVSNSLPLWCVNALFTVVYFLLDDFARFYTHRLMHRWPLLWAFHQVHHSADTLTPFTVFRTHPVEAMIFSLRSTIVQAIAIGGLVFFLGDQADLLTVLGASVFIVIFNMLGANLRHSTVEIAYWKPLEKWLISPAQHQLHHSVAEPHHDKNYGVVLAIWDRLWGSHHYSRVNANQQLPCNRVGSNAMMFGFHEPVNEFSAKGRWFVDAVAMTNKHSLRRLYFAPFIEAASIIYCWFQRCLYQKARRCKKYFLEGKKV